MKKEEYKARYAINNGNGTYRVPLNRISMKIEGNPPCVFGEVANLIGMLEEKVEEQERILKSK